MSEFWMSYEMIAQRYGPGYQGYPLFGAVHWAELGSSGSLHPADSPLVPPQPGTHPAAHLWGVTVLLLADEAVLVIAMLATGQWNWSYLPLHLCSIHIFLCTTCTLTGKDWCKEELYALCTPGGRHCAALPRLAGDKGVEPHQPAFCYPPWAVGALPGSAGSRRVPPAGAAAPGGAGIPVWLGAAHLLFK